MKVLVAVDISESTETIVDKVEKITKRILRRCGYCATHCLSRTNLNSRRIP
jgi:uncharacterized Fe-S radical SAM superfamily protein PflX